MLKNPTPPDNVVKSYSDNAASAQDVITSQNQAKAKVVAAQGEADAQRARASAPPLTADQVADSLGAGWTIEVAEARPRQAADPAGREITIRDAVLRARRDPT